MKCRRINPENGMVIWFGVKDIDIDDDGNISAIFQNAENKHDNYAENSEGIANSIRQQLSVIKHELWYNYNYGLPLIDKVKNKSIIDSYVLERILGIDGVLNVDGFESELDKYNYSCYMIINTKYGQIELGM